MTPLMKDYLLELVRRDLTTALDNVAHAAMRKKRMPFDHDNNNALERYQRKATKARYIYDRLEEM